MKKSFRRVATVCLLLAAAMSANAQTASSKQSSKGMHPAGYRGFVEAGYIAGVGHHRHNTAAISTSHGYQTSFGLFAGLGVGFQGDDDFFGDAPGFVHLRYDFADSRWSPFVETKVGCTLDESAGFYIAPAVGVRLAVGRRCGLNLSVGYSSTHIDDDFYIGKLKFDNTYTARGFKFSLGFDF